MAAGSGQLAVLHAVVPNDTMLMAATGTPNPAASSVRVDTHSPEDDDADRHGCSDGYSRWEKGEKGGSLWGSSMESNSSWEGKADTRNLVWSGRL